MIDNPNGDNGRDRKTGAQPASTQQASETAQAGPRRGAAAERDRPEPAREHGEVHTRQEEFLVTTRRGANLHPLAADLICNALSELPDVTIVDRIKPSGVTVLSANSDEASADVIVIRTTPERGRNLQKSAGPGVILERNLYLQHLAAASPQFSGLSAFAATSTKVRIRVHADDGAPVPKALVVIYGLGFPVQAETDTNGLATLTLYGEQLESVKALYVKPFADYWERWIDRPELDSREVNAVGVQNLSAFPPAGITTDNAGFLGWGQRLMGLDQRTDELTGQGVKIAIIDSGVDNTHPALTHIIIGRDLTNGNDPETWTRDPIAHGTHCAGIIAGRGRGGIRGFAPEAEVHVLKLFPGGAFDDLISALNYCIDNRIDVVNLSLGNEQLSEAVQQRLSQAREAGVAVVVATGNSGGPVYFPATAPGVLAVSAVGRDGDFPADTHHAEAIPPVGSGMIGVNGLFTPRFASFGPAVKVAAPGVAIVSSVPGGGYAASDGTSTAAPHITGLAALLLAHHPAFADKEAPRNAARVDQLFNLILAAAAPIGINPLYVGAGLPTVAAAFAFQQQTARQAAAAPMFASEISLDNVVRQAVAAAISRYTGLPPGGLIPPAILTAPSPPQFLSPGGWSM